jgi:hypothetical protein
MLGALADGLFPLVMGEIRTTSALDAADFGDDFPAAEKLAVIAPCYRLLEGLLALLDSPPDAFVAFWNDALAADWAAGQRR